LRHADFIERNAGQNGRTGLLDIGDDRNSHMRYSFSLACLRWSLEIGDQATDSPCKRQNDLAGSLLEAGRLPNPVFIIDPRLSYCLCLPG
jgi:hypothetical protein